MKKILIVCIILILSSTAAQAQKIYIGMDYANVNYSETGGYEVALKAIRYKLGLLASPYFALEAHYGFGLEHDIIDILGYPVIMKLDDIYGFYVHGILPIENRVKLYAIFGITHATMTASVLGNSFSDSDTDPVLGIGFEGIFNKHISGTAEFIHTIDTIDYDYFNPEFWF